MTCTILRARRPWPALSQWLRGVLAVTAAALTLADAGEPADATATNAPPKPKVGVMKFDVSKSLDPTLSNLLYDVLTEQVVKSGKFIVVDWEQIDRVLQYVAKSQPNLSPEDARRQAVNQLGIQQLYLGSAAKLGSKYFLSVKVLNLDLSVDKVEKESVESEEQMVDAMASITARLLGLPPPETKPATSSESKPAASGWASVTKENPFINTLGMKFVPVPGTKVLFCIWETRVKDFEAFVNDSGRYMGNSMFVFKRDGWKERAGYNWQKPGFRQTPEDPVVGVNWNDAVAFCEWLTKKERKEGRLSGSQSYRLPTDEEWSVAVGLKENPGGLPKDKDEKIPGVYPWGRSWPPPRGAGNYAGSESRTGGEPTTLFIIEGYSDGYAGTAPVGCFEPNELGLYDMGGNVWEWCEDRYDLENDWRVLRGGSWFSGVSEHALSSSRGHGAPTRRSDDLGFRVVLVGASAPRWRHRKMGAMPDGGALCLARAKRSPTRPPHAPEQPGKRRGAGRGR